MRSKKANKAIKKNNIILYSIIILTTIIMLTIGYSAFSVEFRITNTVASIRAKKVVRINGVSSSSGYVSDLDYSHKSIINNVNLAPGQSITYSVTITNLGNVPVAVSNVSFTNGNTPINTLSSNIDSTHYEKICDNGVCTGPVTKAIDITITNNGSETINSRLDASLTFTEVYTITYEGNKLGEALAGSTFTYGFTSNYPNGMSRTSGESGTYSYENHILTVNNVGSDLTFVNKYTVTFDGSEQGYVTHGETYSYEFTSMWPKSVTCTGTYDNITYPDNILTTSNTTLSLTNVQSNIDCVGTYGKIFISSITYSDSVNATDNTPPVANGMEADFDITFKRADDATTNDFYIIYDVTVVNEYYNNYIFNGFDFDPEITANSDEDIAYIEPSLIGITQGEVIPARTTKSFQVKLTLIANNPNGTYGASGSGGAETTEPTVETGTLTATISPNSGNLQSPNTSVSFSVTVNNTYESAKTYSLVSSSSNFVIVDNNDSSISKTIAGSGTDTYTVYVKTSSGAMFKDDSATTNIFLVSDGMANYNVGTLTFDVDVSAGVDTTPPTVSNATLEMVYEGSNSYPTVGSLRASWSGQDNQGGSGVANYTVKLYNSSNTLAKSETVGSTFNTATFTDLADGTYYVVIYAEDNYHNSGASYESQADTSPYAAKSSSNSYKWRFTVDTSGLSQLKCASTTAYLNQNYTCTMSATGSTMNGDRVPDSMTSVYLGTTQLGTNSSATSYYTYTKNSNTKATLVIYNVTATPKLTATASSSTCLVEGTKIKLYDGTYKNVEDIKYSDLLSVWSYDTGSLTYEYPIWIEKNYGSNSYQKTTFSDGTILKTVGLHQVFSLDDNKFVNIYDENGYIKVGTRVAKEVAGKIVPIKVTKVETINEKVNYYYVASSIYYNIISEDIITTSDQIVPGVTLSNMYGFDENIKWPSIRNEIISKEGALYNYKDLTIMPYYLYYGSRGNETKLFVNLGYATTPELIKYLLETQLNQDKAVPPITDKEGNRLWMITTSDDNIKNYKKYLHKEGYVYTLKEPKSVQNKEFVGWFNTESYDYTLKKPTSVKNKEFVGWFNTVDGKMYNVGEKYKLIHGTHFIAIYK